MLYNFNFITLNSPALKHVGQFIEYRGLPHSCKSDHHNYFVSVSAFFVMDRGLDIVEQVERAHHALNQLSLVDAIYSFV